MKKITAILMSCFVLLGVLAPAVFAEGPGFGGGFGGGNSSPSFSGATQITSSVSKTGTKYTSSTGSQNALLASGGSSVFTNITVSKSGDANDENADFYGTNAAVLAYNGASLTITGANITTNGVHANAVFAYENGTIHISDSTIKTTADNSGTVMVTGGGTLTADDVTAETSGRSSAPIRSDRGGGTLVVNGGSYTANGQGSPAVYSTADVTVNDATLMSTSAEGVVIEGSNAVTLNHTTLTDNNVSLNGNSETFKNIFIYQSMSGDASEGTGIFTAKDSSITTEHGDTFFVTNTTAVINLSGNTIINNDESGAFLRAQSGKWGNTGSNGGSVTLNASGQALEGDVIADSISSVDMTLENASTYTGTINGENTAARVALTLDESSVLTLTGDCYISSLTNESVDNANINLNGYTLYVDGKAVTSTAYSAQSENTPTTDDAAVSEAVEETSPAKSGVMTFVIIAVLAATAVSVSAAVVVILARKKKEKAEVINK